tara:strand:+ start:678 stop:1079 length:402 start_codon:yes stop_codon:yes gene_type:complete
MPDQLVSRGFRDISLSFEPHPVTKDLVILRDTACIRKSVSNIVQTIRGERFFDSLFGSNVRKSLFDFVDFATASVLEREIKESILNFEPRITNLRVRVDARPNDNTFEVNIVFALVGLSAPVQNYTFLLEATR